ARRDYLLSFPDDPPQPVLQPEQREKILGKMVDNLNQREELSSRWWVDWKAVGRLNQQYEQLEQELREIGSPGTRPGRRPLRGSWLEPEPPPEGATVVTQVPERPADATGSAFQPARLDAGLAAPRPGAPAAVAAGPPGG